MYCGVQWVVTENTEPGLLDGPAPDEVGERGRELLDCCGTIKSNHLGKNIACIWVMWNHQIQPPWQKRAFSYAMYDMCVIGWGSIVNFAAAIS